MTDRDGSRTGRPAWTRFWPFAAVLLVVAIAAAVISALLVNIFERKQEAKDPYLKLVNVIEETTDPRPWGDNWPREFEQYQRTVEPSRTNFGGGDAPAPKEKAESFPWLTRMFAGYAFSLDYRDRRGHAFMLLDQEKTRRVTERAQPGSCLHCHASLIPTYRRLGPGESDWDKVRSGFVALSAMTYPQAHAEVVKTGSMNPVPTGTGQDVRRTAGAHPVSCVDCHEPNTMHLRVTRPGFIHGI